MDEYAARFCIGGAAGGPERRHVTRSRVAVSRQILEAIQRRDPRRNVSSTRPVFSTYGISWDLPFSQDAGSLAMILAHVCDPGTNEIGHAGRLLQTTASAALADGSEWQFDGGILKDFQIVVDPRQPVGLSTVWQFGKLTETPFPDEPILRTRSGEQAGPQHCSITLGTTPCVTFAGTLAFSREAVPAHFGLDGYAQSFRGQIAMDLVGRMTVRLADGFPVLSDRFADSFQMRIAVGERALLIDVPQASFQSSNRRVVSSSLTDYTVEMLAVKGPDHPLATLTLA